MEPPIQPGETWRMFVAGDPKSQGSKTVAQTKAGISYVRDADKATKPWKQEIAMMAVFEWGPRGEVMLNEPVHLRLTFHVKRPRSHFRKGGELRDAAPLYPETTGNDLDKLARAVLDSLTGIVFVDDRRVVTAPLRRRYGPQAGVEIVVRRMRARTVGDLWRLRACQPDLAAALERESQLALAV